MTGTTDRGIMAEALRAVLGVILFALVTGLWAWLWVRPSV